MSGNSSPRRAVKVLKRPCVFGAVEAGIEQAAARVCSAGRVADREVRQHAAPSTSSARCDTPSASGLVPPDDDDRTLGMVSAVSAD